jgi:hypothetical protein
MPSQESPLGLVKILATVLMFFATISCSLLGWLALSVNELNSQFSGMRTELDFIKPMNLLKEFNEVKRGQLDGEEVEDIIRKTYPGISDWHKASPEWLAWRTAVNDKLSSINRKLEAMN